MIVLGQLINDWLHSKPYIIPECEIRRANHGRFNVTDRRTQRCFIHIVFSGTEIHFWYLDDFSYPTDLRMIGYIDDNFVVFEKLIYKDGHWGDNGMSPADPQFFTWLENNIKNIVRTIVEEEESDVDPI